jgi:hypothetical protein
MYAAKNGEMVDAWRKDSEAMLMKNRQDLPVKTGHAKESIYWIPGSFLACHKNSRARPESPLLLAKTHHSEQRLKFSLCAGTLS